MTEPQSHPGVLCVCPEDDDPRLLTGELLTVPEDWSRPFLVDLLEQIPDDLRSLPEAAPGAAARLCLAGEDLRAELNRQWPDRDRRSDGWLGDAAHRQRKSDHNPNPLGVVTALDVDKDGIPADDIVRHLRQLGAAGDDRLLGGYLIWNWQIAGTHTGWRWTRYTGSNGHTAHFHVSFADLRADYDLRAPWGLVPVRKVDRWLGLHNPPMVGHDVANVQRALNSVGNRLVVDGVYGRRTADLIGLFQRNRRIAERGVGPLTWAALRKAVHG